MYTGLNVIPPSGRLLATNQTPATSFDSAPLVKAFSPSTGASTTGIMDKIGFKQLFGNRVALELSPEFDGGVEDLILCAVVVPEFAEEVAGVDEADDCGGAGEAGRIKCGSKANVPPINATAILPMRPQAPALSPLWGPGSSLPLPLTFSGTRFLFAMATSWDWLEPVWAAKTAFQW